MAERRAFDGWVSVALLREAIGRLNQAWRRLPRHATDAWWRGMGLGAVVTLALTVASTAAARRLAASGALDWEAGALHWFATRAPISFNTAMWIEAPANGFVMWALVLYCAGLSAWRGHALRAVTFLVGHTAVYLPILLGWLLWDRDRPDLVAAGVGTPAGFNSFPYGHVVQAVFAYGLLAALWSERATRRAERVFAALALVTVVTVVAIGRLRLGAHWPSDLAAGALLGASWLGFTVRALRTGERSSAPRVAWVDTVCDNTYIRSHERR